MKRVIFATIMLVASVFSSMAEKFEKDGLFYLVTSDTVPYTAAITYSVHNNSNYSGVKSITIPSSVIYNDKTYTIDQIAGSAFEYCSELESVSIPNSVLYIGGYAFRGCSSLKTLTIPNTVTAIKEKAFLYCYGLTSINIPESVTILGDNAFHDCSSLESIVIPESITSISAELFSGCSSLTSVTIPSSITNIGSDAFEDCSSLTSVNIPASVTSIGYGAFDNCVNLTIYCEASSIPDGWNIDWKSESSKVVWNASQPNENDFEYTDTTKTCIKKYIGQSANVTIPGTVTSIASKAFYNNSVIKTLAIPNSVTSIGANAFAGCKVETLTCNTDAIGTQFAGNTSLKTLVFGDSVATIENSAFRGCSNLESVSFSSSVQSIGDYSFLSCDKLTKVNVESIESWVGIEFSIYTSNPLIAAKHLYVDGTEVTDLVIPSTVKRIGNNAFVDCMSFVSVTIPESVESIGYGAFSYCENIVSVDIPNTVTEIGEVAFYDCINATITLPNTVTSVGDRAFNEVKLLVYNGTLSGKPWGAREMVDEVSLEDDNFVYSDAAKTKIVKYKGQGGDVTIPRGVTSIGEAAFKECESVTSISIPSTVKSIGEDAFSKCTNLTTVNIPNGITSIPNYAFFDCKNLTSVTIPESVTSIGKYAFNNCTKLEYPVIPSSVTEIGTYAFWGISGIVYAGPLTGSWGEYHIYKAKDDNFTYFDKDETQLARYIGKGTTLEIPSTVTAIPDGLFDELSNGSNKLVSVTIPESVTSIGEKAFNWCSSLETVNIPNSVTSIGARAFYCCSSLSTVYIPKSVTSIGDYAFGSVNVIAYTGTATGSPWGARKVLEEEAPVDDFVYSDAGKTQLTGYNGNGGDIVIPSTVTQICEGAFSDCHSLTSVTIPESVVSIQSNAFSGCNNLKKVIIPSSVESIGSGAFADCRTLYYIYIPASVSTINENAFDGCDMMVIYCGASSKPDEWSDNWNPDNRSVTWDADFVVDGDFVFLDDEKTLLIGYNGNGGDVAIPDGVIRIFENVFRNRTDLTSVTMPESFTSIKSNAFRGCSNLKSINIPNKFRWFGWGAFYGCSSLDSIYIPDTDNVIDASVFAGCSKLTIYCAASSKPDAWDSNWNPDGKPVVWNAQQVPEETSSKAYDFKIGDLCYSFLSSWSVKVSFEDSDSDFANNYSNLTSIEIPETVTYDGKTYSVTRIGGSAFHSCRKLTSITIPKSVTSIGSYSFYHCSSLNNVLIPGSVNIMEECVFKDCGSLTIYCEASSKPENWNNNWNPGGRPVVWNAEQTPEETTADDFVFADAAKTQILKYKGKGGDVVIPSTVTNICSGAFSGCKGITSITIPASVANIGKEAFKGCTGLKNIVIPATVVAMGADVFSGCSSLSICCEAISKPLGWTDNWNSSYRPVSWRYNLDTFKYGDLYYNVICNTNPYTVEVCSEHNQFEYFEGDIEENYIDLVNVVIPQTVEYNGLTYTVTYIGGSAFNLSTNIKTIVIPNTVTYIGYWSLAGCMSLESVNIPNSVTAIMGHAFNGCDKLTSVSIPKSVVEIGDFAFDGCGITIYCEAASEPDGWDWDWSGNDYFYSEDNKVVWGYVDINEDAATAVNIYAHHNVIVVENADADIYVYDATGRLVARRDVACNVSITMPHEGLYIVKCGAETKRVVVSPN